MLLKTGEHWHCTNPVCHCEIVIVRASEIDGRNALCFCGSVLKKKYVSPVFTYLDFLRIDAPVTSARGAATE
jgi:hypothetical protein